MAGKINGFYQVTQAIVDHFRGEEGIGAIKVDVLDQTDLDKQDLMTYVHIVPESISHGEKLNEYLFTIYILDLVDENKFDDKDMPNNRGNNNLLDVWHEADKYATNFISAARRGDLWDDEVSIETDVPTSEFVKDKFKNALAGVMLSVTVQAPSLDAIC